MVDNINNVSFSRMKNKKRETFLVSLTSWLRRPDSNRRPLGYEPNELPTAPLRDVMLNFLIRVQRYGLYFKYANVLQTFLSAC